jgi:hypothetical protein
MRKQDFWIVAAVIIPLSLLIMSCSSISPYSPRAYEYATSLKVESLSIMNHATEPFENHQADVEELVRKVDQAYEYANGLPKNEFSAKQWEILKDPDRNLLGGFFKRWENETTLSKGLIDEKKDQIAEAFDIIIGLESKKIKPEDVP